MSISWRPALPADWPRLWVALSVSDFQSETSLREGGVATQAIVAAVAAVVAAVVAAIVAAVTAVVAAVVAAVSSAVTAW